MNPDPSDPFSLDRKTASSPFGADKKNPFLAHAEPESSVSLPTGRELSYESWPVAEPPVNARGEAVVLAGDELTLEVLVTWGASVLFVKHLTPPRNIFVGTKENGDSSGQEMDVIIPEGAMGRSQLPLIVVEGDVVSVVAPDMAEGKVKVGGRETSLAEYFSDSERCLTASRAQQKRLTPGVRVHMQVKDIDVYLNVAQKLAPLPRGFLSGFDWIGPQYFGMTAAFVGTLMLSLAYFAPPLNLLDDEGIRKERELLISQYLDAASEREREAEESPEPDTGAEESGESGQRATGDEGEAGKPDTPRVSARAAAKGPADTPKLELTRRETIELAREFGMVKMLGMQSSATTDVWTNPLGGDRTLGANDSTYQGNMWGDVLGESGGGGGLGLTGPGFGGGDTGNNLGVGLRFGSPIGPGTGPSGFGRSNALIGKGHKTRDINIRTPTDISLSGRLPPQVIRRTVRQNFGRFRHCYEAGLRRNPSLEGRIPVRFLIDSEGSVKSASAMGGFPDAQVKSCVASAFYGLSFPPPEGGVVTVTYPLLFSAE